MFSLGIDPSLGSAWRKAGAILLSLGLHFFVVALMVIVPLLFVGYIIIEEPGSALASLTFSRPGDPDSVSTRPGMGAPRVHVVAVDSQEVGKIKSALFLPVITAPDLQFVGRIPPVDVPDFPAYDPPHGGPCGCVGRYIDRPVITAELPDDFKSRLRQATLVRRVDPQYPPLARQAGIQGAVMMRAIIDREGIVRDVEVLSGPGQLRAAAVDAVRQWRYKPYVLDGLAVDVEITITVNFELAGRA